MKILDKNKQSSTRIQKRHVPFFANTKDDTHCYQAALRMVLKYFIPSKSYSYKLLDKITEKKEGMWTWALKGNIALRKMGFDVFVFNTFDFDHFIREPKGYLRHKYGEEVAREQILHSDVDQAGIDAKQAVRELTIQKLIPTFADIGRLLGEGRLLICLVNSQKLNRKTDT